MVLMRIKSLNLESKALALEPKLWTPVKFYLKFKTLTLLYNYAEGPAARISGVASSAYCLKFLANISANFLACAS